LLEERLTRRVLRVFFDVYNEIGWGLLESVYSNSLQIAFADAGIAARREVALPVYFRGRRVGDFRADFVVEDRVIVEIKAGKAIDASHEAQLDNYLRASGIEVGLLLHFGFEPKFRRRVCQNFRDGIRVHPRDPRPLSPSDREPRPLDAPPPPSPR
jgi:GxxExxY protein